MKIFKEIMLTLLGVIIGMVISITSVHTEISQNKYVVLTLFGNDFIIDIIE